MELDEIRLDKILNARIEDVWAALTDIKQMKKWYFPMLEDFHAIPGFATRFTVHHNGKDFVHCWKVIAVSPNSKLSYEWSYEGIPGNTIVSFELHANEGKTVLAFTHKGLQTFIPSENPALGKDQFLLGWTNILEEQLPAFLQHR